MSACPTPDPVGERCAAETAADPWTEPRPSAAGRGSRAVPVGSALAGCVALSLASGVASGLVAWHALGAPAEAAAFSPEPAAAPSGPPAAGLPRAEALLLAALALEDAASGSAPFAGELAYAMRAAGRDPELLAPLDRMMGWAEAGVPSRADLLARFAQAAAAARAAARAARPGGLVDRATLLMRDAALGVGIGEPPAGDPGLLVDRAAEALAAGRLDAARAELAKAPPAVAAAVSTWVRDAGRRVEAEAATREFRQLALDRALR